MFPKKTWYPPHIWLVNTHDIPQAEFQRVHIPCCFNSCEYNAGRRDATADRTDPHDVAAALKPSEDGLIHWHSSFTNALRKSSVPNWFISESRQNKKQICQQKSSLGYYNCVTNRFHEFPVQHEHIDLSVSWWQIDRGSKSNSSNSWRDSSLAKFLFVGAWSATCFWLNNDLTVAISQFFYLYIYTMYYIYMHIIYRIYIIYNIMWGYLGNHAQNGSKLVRERSFDLRMLHTSSPARNLKGCGLIWDSGWCERLVECLGKYLQNDGNMMKHGGSKLFVSRIEQFRTIKFIG